MHPDLKIRIIHSNHRHNRRLSTHNPQQIKQFFVGPRGRKNQTTTNHGHEEEGGEEVDP